LPKKSPKKNITETLRNKYQLKRQ